MHLGRLLPVGSGLSVQKNSCLSTGVLETIRKPLADGVSRGFHIGAKRQFDSLLTALPLVAVFGGADGLLELSIRVYEFQALKATRYGVVFFRRPFSRTFQVAGIEVDSAIWLPLSPRSVELAHG